jgi:hypothetical protein
MRVVGDEPAAAAPSGTVCRVVRAPVFKGDSLFREGEVLVAKAP